MIRNLTERVARVFSFKSEIKPATNSFRKRLNALTDTNFPLRQENQDIKLPSSFCDSISFELMDDPMILGTPDQVIDRTQIQRYRKNDHYINPFTMTDIIFLPNDLQQIKNNERHLKVYQLEKKLRSQIDRFLSRLEQIHELHKELQQTKAELFKLQQIIEGWDFDGVIDEIFNKKLTKFDFKLEIVREIQWRLVHSLELFIKETQEVINETEHLSLQERDLETKEVLQTATEFLQVIHKELVEAYPSDRTISENAHVQQQISSPLDQAMPKNTRILYPNLSFFYRNQPDKAIGLQAVIEKLYVKQAGM